MALDSKNQTRLEPLGASEDRSDNDDRDFPSEECEEKEYLQSSLLSLTTHFAQVQFRIRQVVEAPFEDQETLLKELGDFAFSGISELDVMKQGTSSMAQIIDSVRTKRAEQRRLLYKLKVQLREIRETYGDDIFPQKMVKHMRAKEKLEKQLKTQIVDLERFVCQLRGKIEECKKEEVSPSPFRIAVKAPNLSRAMVKCSLKNQMQKTKKLEASKAPEFKGTVFHHHQSRSVFDMIQRIGAFLYSVMVFHFNCRRIDHRSTGFVDLQEKLDLSIWNIKHLLETRPAVNSGDGITAAVKKELTVSIKNLIEHGTKQSNALFMPSIVCLHISRLRIIHSWDIIMDYYNLSGGEEFNSAPLQSLSSSFKLELCGTKRTNKKLLLCTINKISSTHGRYRRSSDSQFNAFVFAGLNTNKLVAWLNLIFMNKKLVKTHYHPWSYVAATKYRDGLKSLDELMWYKFRLPVDLEVQRFKSFDAFV